jgi:agmatine deiminase
MKTDPGIRETPAALGFAMPADWAPHEATWLGWPHNRQEWKGKTAPVRWVFAEMVRKIAPGEAVHIIVEDGAREKRARDFLENAHADTGRITYHRWPTDREWLRDCGPIGLRRAGPPPEVALAKFEFTGWGGRYPDFARDNEVPPRVAEALALPLFPVELNGRPFALEGGGIDVNGRGSVLVTEECYLDPAVQVRNPGATRADYEAAFRDYLGAPNVLWLSGGIEGDDTHGHVDDLCRFVNPTTVVMIQESDPNDVNYRPLRENRERLQGMRLEDGSKIEVVELPCPAPLYHGRWRLPATYANFYIANAVVIVPTFNDPNDRVALGALAELFPGRTVVGIHAVDLVLGFGTLHCLTQQQPKA